MICPPSQTDKILDADCTCPYSPYSPYGDMVGPYRSYGDDVAVGYWLVVGLLDDNPILIIKINNTFILWLKELKISIIDSPPPPTQ